MSFTYLRTVRLCDTDAAGVVYFAQVLSMCHEAYEESLKTAGINLKVFFNDTSMAIPIVHGAVDFFSPIFCGDTLLIDLAPQLLSNNEFEVAYQIYAASDSQTCLAKAKTRHVCIHLMPRRRTQLPQVMIQWLHSVIESD